MVLPAPSENGPGRQPGQPPDKPPRFDCCGARCTVGTPPRTKAEKAGVRARPLLENSTACRKSVPSSSPFFVGFFGLMDVESVSSRFFRSGLSSIYGEFDPGSGRTLAACLTHASRTVISACGVISGERVSNTWATCPRLWDNSKKLVLIPDIHFLPHGGLWKVFRLGMGPRPISLLVG